MYLKKICLLTIALIGIASCNKDTPQQASVRLSEDSNFGKILTDREGLTLYFFSNDTKNNSTCLEGCVDDWPIFFAEDLTLDESLSVSDFETISRPDGKKQTTYKGWPLYYYKNDATRGETKGDGVGKVWYVAKPDYTVMYTNAQLVGNDGKNYTSNYTEGDGLTMYITDDKGRTLYIFVRDSKNTNNFTLENFSNNNVWPIFQREGVTRVPSILNTNDFGTIDVFGRKQLTYKKWPLYYFGQDTNRGDNKGVSVPNPGVWPVPNTETKTAQ